MTNKKIVIYTLPVCPNCRILKDTLTKQRIEYEEEDLETPKSKTFMLMHSIFSGVAPILAIGDTVYQYAEIFYTDGLVKEEIIERCLDLS
jgi:Glutaredoxin.